MPSRRICLSILLFWTYAAAGLFHRDILPELVIGPPPDLRDYSGVADADEGRPVRWTILRVDERDPTGMNERAVGQAVTEVDRQRDGGIRLNSQASFDWKQILPAQGQGGQAPPPPAEGPLTGYVTDRIEIYGTGWIDPSGNLESFLVAVREGGPAAVELLAIEGRLRNDRMHITSRGLLPYFGPKSFAYQPHSMVQTGFSPLGRLPGLNVGQRWQDEVVSPLTGQLERSTSIVERTRVITWDGNPVTTFEVVSRTEKLPMTARTWVRRDGLVLRQEVPFPLVQLVLERVPDEPEAAR